MDDQSKSPDASTVQESQVQQTVNATQPQAAVIAYPLSTPPNTKPKKKLLSVCLVILVILIALGCVVAFYRSNKQKAINSKSAASSTTKTNDSKIEQDLASIGNSLANGNSYNAPFIPNSLSQLHLKLNYNVNSYVYKVIHDEGSEMSNLIVYQICANFKTNTFSVSAYNNIFDESGVDGTLAGSYSVHSSGQQCYTNDISYTGKGLSVNLNSSENQYKAQLETDSGSSTSGSGTSGSTTN